MVSVCKCRGSALERGAGWAISGLRSVAHAHDTYSVCTISTVYVQNLAVSLRWFTDDWPPADSHAWPRIFWTRSWFAAADGWARLPRKVTRWPPGNVRSRTLTDAYRRLRALIPGAGLLLLPRVTVSNRTPVWLGLKGPVTLGYGLNFAALHSAALRGATRRSVWWGRSYWHHTGRANPIRLNVEPAPCQLLANVYQGQGMAAFDGRIIAGSGVSDIFRSTHE